jgi:hypothetical protein
MVLVEPRSTCYRDSGRPGRPNRRLAPLETFMPDTLTRRQGIVLAALATDSTASFAPVQVQKLFFLVDENLHSHLGGKLFGFQPYNYGPFDAEVYRELEALAAQGLLIITPRGGGQRRYVLTPSGYERGRQILSQLTEPITKYFTDASQWVRSMSFPALVGSIYKAYPHMRANSIFQA